MQLQCQCQSKIDYYVVGVDLLNAICVSFAAIEWISYDSKYHITHIFQVYHRSEYEDKYLTAMIVVPLIFALCLLIFAHLNNIWAILCEICKAFAV